MQNLSVVFPERDPTHPTPPYIDKEIQVAYPAERINWTFYTVEKSIKYVEVEFGKGKFFEGAVNPRKFTAEVRKGQAIIYGTAPDYKDMTEDKYTLRGYDADPGNPNHKARVVSELDPKIVVAVP